ncbi:hypothetical protein HDU87_004568 [Geranomyces variabilis]|uniref:GPI inositol-deacylase n=1 Tax=Geranomyces variabilis TaxID=109894 RepID=A0AAD5XQK6_9FUNG|nr:hypothetical protein HDU87_004568 [Geranomyces variabilis]
MGVSLRKMSAAPPPPPEGHSDSQPAASEQTITATYGNHPPPPTPSTLALLSPPLAYQPLHPPKTMLLFVHGFLGSESSFEDFPLDLAARVRAAGARDIEVRIFPRFDTKGDPTRAVNQLCNWLMLNAAQPEYHGVIVLAHSMGGLMAVDAYRKLYGLWNEEEEERLAKEEREKKAKEAKEAKEEKERKAKEEKEKKAQLAKEKKDQKAKGEKEPIAKNARSTSAADTQMSTTPEPAVAVPDATPQPMPELADSDNSKPDAATTDATAEEAAAQSITQMGAATQPTSWLGAVGSWWSSKKDAPPTTTNTAEQQAHPTTTGVAALEVFKSVAAEMEPAPSGAPPTTDPTAVVSDALAQQPSLRKSPPVRMIGIVTFDTPFFGLHTRVYTAAAGTRAAAVVSQYVPPLPPMPAAPAVPFADAFSAIPEAVGHGIQTGSKAAGDALRYGTRAVGSIPEAAQGIAAALPGAVAAMPGAATQGLQMGLQAVSALPGGALHLGSSALSSVSALPGGAMHFGSSALSSVAGLPAYWTSKAVAAPAPATTEVATAEPISLPPSGITEIETVEEDKATDPSEKPRDTPALPPRADESLAGEPSQNPPRRASQDEMQDETVVFAAAVAAAAATVQESQSHNTPPASDSTTEPTIQSTDMVLLLPPEKLDTPGDASIASASAVGLHPIPSDSNWAPWVRLGLAGAAVAAGAYYSGGLVFAAPVVRRVAVAYALSHAEDARKHLQFLYPLWGAGTKVLARRLDDVAAEVGEGRLGFACFYAELPLPPVRDTTQQKAAEKTSSQRVKTRLATLVGSNSGAAPAADASTTTTTTTTTTTSTAATSAPALPPRAAPNPVVLNSPVAAAFATQLAAARAAATTPPPPPLPAQTDESANPTSSTPSSASSPPPPPPPPAPHTFIALPPRAYAHMFRPVTIDASDEIHAHMNMFARDVNAGGYWGLVDRVAAEVAACLRRAAA